MLLWNYPASRAFIYSTAVNIVYIYVKFIGVKAALEGLWSLPYCEGYIVICVLLF